MKRLEELNLVSALLGIDVHDGPGRTGWERTVCRRDRSRQRHRLNSGCRVGWFLVEGIAPHPEVGFLCALHIGHCWLVCLNSVTEGVVGLESEVFDRRSWNTILQTTQLSADPDYPADDSVDAAFSDLEGPHSNVDAFSFDPIVLIQAMFARLPTSTSGCVELPRDCGGEQLMTRWGRLVCHAVSLRLMTTRSSDRGRGGPSRHWCLYSRSATSRLRSGDCTRGRRCRPTRATRECRDKD